MQINRTVLAFIFMAWSAAAVAADGLITLKSRYGAVETMDRLEQQVRQRGLTVFARIDHATGAAKAGKTLRPTTLLVFGNPQGGTPFMQCEQTVGIDLPLRALVWEDAFGQVWLGYNDPAYIARRHSVSNCPVVKKLVTVLYDITKETVAD